MPLKLNETSPWMTEELGIFREAVRKFIQAEFVPAYKKWEEQQYIDKDAWLMAGEIGMLCADIPEDYGGAGGTFAYDCVVNEELAYAGISSFGNAVHSITAHYLLAYGTDEQKQRWLPKMVTGEIIGAIAMSEAVAGSDLQGISTRAVRGGDHYFINGSKTFISNGHIADLICVAVKTEPGQGAKGISLIMIEAEQQEGFRRGKILNKIGQKAQDTSELFFDDCRVPVDQLLGGLENQGFYQMMNQLPRERLIVSVLGIATIERAIKLTVGYTTERKAFGKRIAEFQNTRFKLAECQTEALVGRVFIDYCIQLLMQDQLDAETASMAKWWITEKQCQIVDECVQFHGGYGYMLEYPIAQMYADSRAQKIYAGSNEIMKELIARSLLGGN